MRTLGRTIAELLAVTGIASGAVTLIALDAPTVGLIELTVGLVSACMFFVLLPPK